MDNKSELIEAIRAIPGNVDAAKTRKIENWPVRSNRASQIGHPCLRFLTYLRSNWRDRALHSVETQYLFDERKRQERNAVQDLEEAGYEFIEEQRGYAWEKYEISGKIDGKLRLPKGDSHGTLVPAEIKNINRWDWERVDENKGIAQFLESDKVWLRTVPGQIVSYLLMDNRDLGALILRNADIGRLKVLPVELDWTLGEEVVRKAEAVNAHYHAGTLPDRIPYDPDICGRCAFFHICLPEAALESPTWDEDPDLLRRLDRLAELKPVTDEHRRLDEDLKDLFRKASAGQTNASFVVGGKWFVSVSDREVRAELKPRPARTDRPVKIQRLGVPPTIEPVPGGSAVQ